MPAIPHDMHSEKQPALKADINAKADAWAIRKMCNHVRRLRSRSGNQKHEEVSALAEPVFQLHGCFLCE